MNRDVLIPSIIAPVLNFVYTENNEVMSRGDVIRSVNGPDKVTWARNEGMRLHGFGDVEVITGVWHLKGTGNKGVAFDKADIGSQTRGKKQRRAMARCPRHKDYLIP